MYQSGIQMWNPSVEHFRLVLLFCIDDWCTGGHGKTALCATWLPASPYLLCICVYVFVFANVMVIANKHSFIHSNDGLGHRPDSVSSDRGR